MGIKVFFHASLRPARRDASTRHCCCCYISHTKPPRGRSLIGADVGGVQTQPRGGRSKPAPSARPGLPGRAGLPTWLAVTQREPRLSLIHNTHSGAQRNESGFVEAKLFASKLQNFHSERITPENGLRTAAWAHNCSAAAVYLLKCERLIRPRDPWWDSLITCHWDLCKW